LIAVAGSAGVVVVVVDCAAVVERLTSFAVQ
jgi:hypothetical protein